MRAGRRAHASFAGQARGYERRVGLGAVVCRRIAETLVDLAPSGRLLELGAGSGEIGQWLHKNQSGYLGMDLSESMLGAFRRRSPDASLRVGDARDPWPLGSGEAVLVFGSRVLHLLGDEHVASEFCRVGAPASHLALGRVHIDKQSIKSRMRRHMRALMREQGLVARAGESGRRSLAAACIARGARQLPEVCVARWTVRHSARRSLDSWRGKEGLGGVAPPAAVKDRVLAQLEAWALQEFGDLDRSFSSQESYVLTLLQK